MEKGKKLLLVLCNVLLFIAIIWFSVFAFTDAYARIVRINVLNEAVDELGNLSKLGDAVFDKAMSELD